MPDTNIHVLYNLLFASPHKLRHIAPFHVLIMLSASHSLQPPQIQACCTGCGIRTRNWDAIGAPGDLLCCLVWSNGLSHCHRTLCSDE